MNDAEWHVIHEGKTLGPWSLAELADQVAAGKIEPDDLVKKNDGMWTMARDLEIYRQRFRPKPSEEANQGAIDKLGSLHGIWLSEKALIGGCVVMVLFGVGLAAVLANRGPTLAGTTWRGSENLNGFGSLTFEFRENGTAIMLDARSQVKGRWSQRGNDVTISFTNCEYKGTIDGRVLRGKAQMLDRHRGVSWSYSVTKN